MQEQTKTFFFMTSSNQMHTEDGDNDGADLPSCELRTRIKFDNSVRDDEPLPLERNRCD